MISTTRGIMTIRHRHTYAPPRRRWPRLLLVVVLALSGTGISYAWPEIASLIPSVGRETPAEQLAASDKEALPELLASQQKIEDDIAALTKSMQISRNRCAPLWINWPF
jgi:hypothetical protein